MSEHTKEPWAHIGNEVRTEDRLIALALNNSQDDCKTNARRIVACVNACAGVEMESLERTSLKGLQETNEAHVEMLAKCMQQRDELLGILKEAYEELRLIRMKDSPAVYDPTLRTRIEITIAKAESKL